VLSVSAIAPTLIRKLENLAPLSDPDIAAGRQQRSALESTPKF
jgi:hypothetical protein